MPRDETGAATVGLRCVRGIHKELGIAGPRLRIVRRSARSRRLLSRRYELGLSMGRLNSWYSGPSMRRPLDVLYGPFSVSSSTATRLTLVLLLILIAPALLRAQ